MSLWKYNFQVDHLSENDICRSTHTWNLRKNTKKDKREKNMKNMLTMKNKLMATREKVDGWKDGGN